MFRVISINLNGIRAADRKGFFPWMRRQKADVICMQEVRAEPDQLDRRLSHPRGYHAKFFCAEKRGYSGVAIYSKHEPDRIIEGWGIPDYDREGRYLQYDFGNLSVASVYLPSGSSGDERQAFKERLMKRLKPRLKRMRESGRQYILCGDFNIAHTQADIENWRGNQKNSGFLPQEREGVGALLRSGWVDAFRVARPEPKLYSWWSNRGRARENNVGWRIDYQLCTPDLGARVVAADIYKRRFFSDHAPVRIDYDIPP